MLLLDAAPLVALLTGEPAAPAVRSLLTRGDAAIPAPNLAEVVDRLMRRSGVPEEALRKAVAPLLDEVLIVLETTADHAWRGGLLRARHYRRDRPLSMLDCLLLACAGTSDALVTSDRALIATARDEGIAVEPVADSTGRTPPAQ